MDSRELGLVLARHLLDVEDLHYGWWSAGETPTLAGLAVAQRRHAEVLLEAAASMLPAPASAPMSAPAPAASPHASASTGAEPPLILDVGCGTGALAARANARGWACDGLLPSAALAARARQALAPWPARRVFECRLEDALGVVPAATYELAWFSESFQYVEPDAGLRALSTVLKPGAAVLVFDVFARDDAPPGKAPIGGGHRLSIALEAFRRHGFALLDDADHSAHLAPNLDLLQSLLRDRLRPSAAALDAYLLARHGLLWRGFKWLQRRRLAKLSRRWGETRDAATFLRYKTYRLLRFRLDAAKDGVLA